MGKKHKHPEHVNHERWLVSYADFITLLFATFTALYALSKSDAAKAKAVADGMREAFGTGTPQIITMEAPHANGIPSKEAREGNKHPAKGKEKGQGDKKKQAGKQEFEKIKSELEQYLMWRARGMKMESPAVRP